MKPDKETDVVQSVPAVTESELAATASTTITPSSGTPVTITKLSTATEPESVAKDTVILRSSIAEAQGLALVKSYKSNCQLAEEQALNFLGDQTHHPVISCFRELTKVDFNSIFCCTKFKRQVNTLEKSIIQLGMVDYIAAAVNNPLYSESFSTRFSTTAPVCLQKIMMDFKTTIRYWAICESDVLNKRATLILSYLRRLVPMFKLADFETNFEVMLDSVESEIARNEPIKNGWGKHDTSNVSASSDDRSALGKIDLNLDVKDEENTSPVQKGKNVKIAVKKSPKTASSKPKNIRESVTFSFDLGKNKKSSANDDTKSVKPIGTPTSKVAQPQSKPVSDQKPSNCNTKRGSTEELLCSDGGPTKKLKIDNRIDSNSDSSSSNCKPSKDKSENPDVVKMKGKVNAFAFLMNRSRELAQQNKLKKLAAVAKSAPKVT